MFWTKFRYWCCNRKSLVEHRIWFFAVKLLKLVQQNKWWMCTLVSEMTSLGIWLHYGHSYRDDIAFMCLFRYNLCISSSAIQNRFKIIVLYDFDNLVFAGVKRQNLMFHLVAHQVENSYLFWEISGHLCNVLAKNLAQKFMVPRRCILMTSLTFYPAQEEGWHICFWVKYLNIYWSLAHCHIFSYPCSTVA